MSDYYGQGRPGRSQSVGPLEGPLEPPDEGSPDEPVEEATPACVICGGRDDVQIHQPGLHPEDGVCFVCREDDPG